MSCTYCGPAVKHHARGLCKNCYYKTPDQKKKAAVKRAERYATPEGKAKRAAASRRWYSKPESKNLHRMRIRRKAYGLSAEQLRRIRDAVCCEACNRPFKVEREKHVDHDHSTGFFRGVLCRGCNMALGSARDSLSVILSLGVYLEKHLTDTGQQARLVL